MENLSREPVLFQQLQQIEDDLIKVRRKAAGVDEHKQKEGIAFSGGGIRSATFCLGIYQALMEKSLSRHIDYMSSVSGGGYFAGFYQSLLARTAGARQASAARDDIAEVHADLGSEDSRIVDALRRMKHFKFRKWKMLGSFVQNLAVVGLMTMMFVALTEFYSLSLEHDKGVPRLMRIVSEKFGMFGLVLWVPLLGWALFLVQSKLPFKSWHSVKTEIRIRGAWEMLKFFFIAAGLDCLARLLPRPWLPNPTRIV
jgi:hypothetical protein